MVDGLHDLRVAIIDKKAVWVHIRTPPPGSFKANVAQRGEINEVSWERLPGSVKKIVSQIADKFYKEYDNPFYSIDFGMGKDGPLIFELNDQIGFPTWEMKGRDRFLNELVESFALKLESFKQK